MTASKPEPHHAKAIEDYFLGDAQLFYGFLEACFQQLPSDIAQGDKALAASDLPALRVEAHNLKSVLQTLGYAALHVRARTLEQSCVAGDYALSASLWAQLRNELLQLSATIRPEK